MQYAEILVDVANRRLDQIFHYRVPQLLTLKVGMRVIVPLGHRQVQGIVLRRADVLPEEAKEHVLKDVLAVVDDALAIPEDLLNLALWMAERTLCPIAQSLHTVWPLMKGKVEEWVVPLASKEDEDVQTLKFLDPEVYKGFTVLFRAKQKALPLSVFLKRSGFSQGKMDELLNQGWLRIESRFTSGIPAGARKQPPGETQLLEAKLITEGWKLTPEQAEACQGIEKALDGKAYQTILLHGVTGSGKTEVYREVITKVIAQGGTAILLVPEISLTSQVAYYFQKQFGHQVIVMHSGLKSGEKVKAWQEILKGQVKLVIGARSAVFAPLTNLRLIILDEEHEGAYKQDENPKYHARDVARKRMEQHQGVVVLGSATPSLEAYAAAQTGQIGFTKMEHRVADRPLPPVEIVDMREELMKGNRSMFSVALQSKIRSRLETQEQSMIFLNRRGYSTFVNCRECGYVVRCPDCDVALTYHSNGQVMRCHYCNHEEVPPHVCPECGSRYIRFFGQGTQRVEEELQGLFPKSRILRLDWDTTRAPENYNRILSTFRKQEADILVGTQMLAKGLDFPNVTLVGVIAADQLLNMPDFRAKERAFQLLTQVAGRTGRSNKPGEVVFQTYSPKDRAIVLASQHDYLHFFWEEIKYRKDRRYPPFTHVIRVILLHEKEDRVIKAAHSLTEFLRLGILNNEGGYNDLVILGPAPAVLARLKNKFRWQVLVKGKRLEPLRAFLHQGVQKYAQDSSSQGVQLNIEVDPLSMG
ncbi:replication restart helicase PriA [Desulfitobacterium metallireducens]|uniref:Replication restart protein PriA n=1 Tax=Desulfitobacterium metallireducens DSM 15288 TaxID=871968 RepID=W0E9V6_9FIRM|nr:primosomal protein N' [Desulfitobacterium metallireducens]AHF07645.1 primosomal protein [Desulfitobacterium metallireducens DSM 15288]